MTIGVPLSSEEIPAGTGLVQFIECKGKVKNSITPPLGQSVIAQISTFANGVRQVSCSCLNPNKLPDGRHLCSAGRNVGEAGYCIYSWEDNK